MVLLIERVLVDFRFESQTLYFSPSPKMSRARRTVSRGGFRADSHLDGTAPPGGGAVAEAAAAAAGTPAAAAAAAPKEAVFWPRRVLLDHSLALWHPSG